MIETKCIFCGCTAKKSYGGLVAKGSQGVCASCFGTVASCFAEMLKGRAEKIIEIADHANTIFEIYYTEGGGW